MNPTNPAYPNKTYLSNNSLFPLLSSPLPLPVSNATSRSQLKSYQRTNPNPRSAQAQVLRLSFAGMAQLILVLLLIFNLALDASNFRNAVTQAAAQAQAQATAAAQTSAVPNEAGAGAGSGIGSGSEAGAGAGNIPPVGGGVLAGAAGFATHLAAPFLLSGPVCPTQTGTLTPTLTYLGATSSSWGNGLGLAALLTDPAGNPLASNVLTFTLSPGNGSGGSPVLTTTATTDANGFARTIITPTAIALPPGAATLKASWPGSGSGGSGPTYSGASLSQAVTLTLEPTIISYVGNSLPGLTAPAQPVSAKLLDAFTGLPIAGVTLSFSLGSAPVVSATTDATGTASATLTLTPDQAIGQPPLVVRWAGDSFRQASSLNVPSSFYLDSAFGTVVVRHAPNFSSNARVTGSIRQLLPEYDTLNTGVVINGDLLVPGSPSVQTNGSGITFGGIVTGTGSASPSNYSVSLNDNTTLGHLIIRTDAVTLSAVPAPPLPTGTRDISINGPSDTIGNPATLRNVTLNTNAGAVALPPGTYGTFSANTGSSYVLGITGTITPVVYNVQGLSFNGTASLSVVGPIILNTATGFSFGGLLGNSAQPLWLEVNASDGSGITLNTGATFYGVARSPSGGVTLNGGTTLKGSVFADRLSFNSGSVATIQGVSVPTSTTTTAPVLTGSLYPAGSSPTAPTGPVILPGSPFNWQLAVTNTTTAGGGGGNGSATSVVANSNFPNTLPNTRTTTISSLLAAGGASTTATLTETVASFTTTRQTATESSPVYQTRLGTQNGVSLWGRSLLTWGDTSDQAYVPLNVLGQPTPTEGLPLLSLGLSTPAGCAVAGSVLTYTVRVSNVGSAAAQSGTVSLTYPDATTGSLSFGPVAVGGVYTGSLSWSVPASTTQATILTTKGQVNWQDGATNPGPNSYGPVEAQLLTSVGTSGGGGGGGGTGGTPGLFFQTGPGGAQAGLPFLTQPVVVKLLADGTTDTAFTGPITLTLKSGTGTSGAVLSGPTIVNAVGGVATYGGLSINLVGTGYVLSASAAGSTGLLPVDSPAFNVVTARTGPTTIVARSGSGQTATTGQGFGSPLIAFVSNGNGQSVGAGTSVTFVIMTGSSGAGATFTGTGGGTSVTVATDANGLATTPTLTANGTAGTFLVKATTPGVGAGANFVLNNTSPTAQAKGITVTLDPIVSGPNPINSSVALTATVTRYGVTNLGGQSVTFKVTDAANGNTITTTTRTTASDGTASFSYSSPLTGTHLVTANVNEGGLTISSTQASIYWVALSHPVSLGQVYSSFYSSNNETAFVKTPADKALFTKIFPDIDFPNINCTYSQTNYPNSCPPFTDNEYDVNGGLIATIIAQGNGYIAGVNTGPNNSMQAVFTGTLIVKTAGTVTFDDYADAGIIFSVGNGTQCGNSTNCPAENITTPFGGVGPFTGFPILAAYSHDAAFSHRTFDVTFPGAGIYPFELDYFDDNAGTYSNGHVTLGVLENSVLTNLRPISTVSLTPRSDAQSPIQNSLGLTQTMRVHITDNTGNAAKNISTTLSINGANTITQVAITDNNGDAIFNFTSQVAGSDVVQADAWVKGALIYSTESVVEWYCGTAPSTIFTDTFINTNNFAINTPYAFGNGTATWTTSNNTLTASSLTGDVIAVSNLDSGPNYTYEADFTPLSNSSYAGFGLYSTANGSDIYRFMTGFNPANQHNLAYADRSGIRTYYNQPSTVVSYTVGTTYHIKVKATNGTQFVFSVNNITQFVVNETQLPLTTGKLALVGGGGNFAFQNLRVSNNYPDAPPVSSLCGGGNDNPLIGCVINPGWLVSPTNPTTLSSLSAIVPSSGTNLPAGTVVQIYPANQPSYSAMITLTTLSTAFSGDGVTALPVKLDPSILANGSYILRIAYTDGSNNCQSSLTLIRVIGENKPGRVTFSLTDLTVPLAGLPIVIGRTYDSLDRNRPNGDFGPGWSLSVGNPKLEVNPAGDVTITTLDGKRSTFYFTPGYPGPQDQTFLGSHPINVFGGFLLGPAYTPEPGVYGALSNNGCGIVSPFSGGGYVCFPGSRYLDTVSTYFYHDPYGRVYSISAPVLDSTGKQVGGGKLQALSDLQGNTLLFNDDGIAATNGASGTCKTGDATYIVCFGRDSANGNRITAITDTMGYVYQYNYASTDGPTQTTGDLTSVKLPSVPAISYTYYTGTLAHFFASAQDPRGNTAVTTQYYTDAANNGRLKSVAQPVSDPTSGVSTVYTTSYTYDIPNNLTFVTNPDGGQTASQTDPYGKVISQTDALSRTTKMTYDSLHQLTQTSLPSPTTGRADSPDSRVMTATFDTGGHQIGTGDPLGHTTATTYTPYGGPQTITDQVGHTYNVGYGQVSNPYSTAYELPTSVSDTLNGQPAQVGGYDFDDRGSVLARYDGKGGSTRFTYDAQGNKATETDAQGHTTSYHYDRLGRMDVMTDANGVASTYSYDPLGRLTTSTMASNTGRAMTTVSHYDANGNKTDETDALSHTTYWGYDTANRTTVMTYSNGTVVKYAYDWRGNKTSQTDQLGRVTTMGYDLAGQSVTTTVSANFLDVAATTVTAYDLAGRKVRDYNPYTATLGSLPPGQPSVKYDYDAASRLTTLTDQANHQTTYIYDNAGRKTSETDARTNTTQYHYDERGRLDKTTYPTLTNGTIISTSQSYDPAGNVVGRTDGGGKTTGYTYDTLNRLTAVTNPMGQPTSYQYDALGRLSTILDANSHTTGMGYDELGRQTTKVWPDGSTERYGYDTVGNRTSQALSDGVITNTFSYDALNRLRQANYASAGTGTLARTVVYTYTATGQRQSINDSTYGTTSYSYDNRDRVVQIQQPQIGTVAAQSVGYGYDERSNRTVMTTTAPSASLLAATSYGYDAVGRLQSVLGPNDGGTATIYQYYDNGLRWKQTLPNGIVSTYLYDPLNRLTEITQIKNGATPALADYQYGLDGAGNRTAITETTNYTSTQQTRQMNYGYDGAYR